MSAPMSAPIATAEITALLDTLARFGGGASGVTRLVYDPAWCAAQQWLQDEARARGLTATVDAAGNLFLHDAAVHADDLARPVLWVGSHLDTVPGGGRYDGAYGVVAGLLLAAAHRGRPGLPVVGFVTAEEEQSRFDAPMMGARSLLGLTTSDELDRVHDRDGVTWRAARDAAERAGCAAALTPGVSPLRPRFRATVTLEPHIEQGPVLEQRGIGLGIVTAIAGYRRLKVEVTGAPRHAGTTPMNLRHDALAGAAEMVLAAERLAVERGDPARATAGRLVVSPGAFNVSPGHAELWLELRHGDETALATLASELETRCRAIASQRGLGLVVTPVTGQTPTPLSDRLVTLAETVARDRGETALTMTSGAGHDSMEFARAGAESLMVFVPSRGGVSHSPEEWTHPDQLAAGLRFADAVIGRIVAETPA